MTCYACYTLQRSLFSKLWKFRFYAPAELFANDCILVHRGEWNQSQEKQLKQQLLEAERAAEAVAAHDHEAENEQQADREEKEGASDQEEEEKKEDATPMDIDTA